MARIEGTGIKTPSSGSQKMAKVYYGGPEAEKRRQLKKDLDKFMKDFGGSPASDKFNPKGTGMGDRFDPTASRPNYFSPGGGAFDSRNDVQVASADLGGLNVGDSFTKQVESNLADSSTGEAQPLSKPGSDEFNQEVKQFEKKVRKDTDMIERYGTDELRNLTNEGQKRLEDSYKIYRDYNYERNPLKYQQGIDFSKKEEKKGFGERISNLAGSIFNTVTGTQPAAASQIPGGLPSVNQFSPSGDTSFSSFRMGGGVEGQQSGIVTPFSQTSMGKGEPRNITKFQDTSMGRKTVTVGGQEVAKRQTVASLPSNYKQTEAREFAKAKAFEQAKKNPNVTVGVDSKGQPTATAVQRGRGESGGDNTAQGNQARVQQNAKARAQAAAYNRRISGKSISQVKAANRQSMRDSAAERQAAFKKTGKSTVSARRAAAKKSVQAAAKKRNAAFKARRKARRSGRRGGRR